MRGKRLWHTLRLWLIPSATKRAVYLKKKNVFYSMGENCLIMYRKVPLYAKLIKLGNNVKLASNVSLVTHDIVHLVLNKIPSVECQIAENMGCIEIGDNVFVGANTTILYNVKIGSNVIIGANSLVNKDIPDNSVCCGCPAKVIGSFDDFVSKRVNSSLQLTKCQKIKRERAFLQAA